MTPTLAKPLPPAALCEVLLRQSHGCAWLLQRDGMFHAVYGAPHRVFGRTAAELRSLNFAELFPLKARAAWCGRLARAFAGETLGAAGQFGESAATFSIALFPVEVGDNIAFAGGIAHEMTGGGLVLRKLEALEADCARLSQLLHDHIGQGLSAAGLQLDLLRMDLAEAAQPIPQRIGEIQNMLETIMGLVRNVNRELNPAVAERLGLRAALDELAGTLRANFKGTVRVFADAKAQPPPEAAAALYRIAQEAASNAVRRTGCSAIEILLKSPRVGPTLEIRDDAPGLDGAAGAFQAGGVDLLVMQHIADRADIELQIDSAPDKGTVLRALWRSG